jgi:hypothetical protein
LQNSHANLLAFLQQIRATRSVRHTASAFGKATWNTLRRDGVAVVAIPTCIISSEIMLNGGTLRRGICWILPDIAPLDATQTQHYNTRIHECKKALHRNRYAGLACGK